jgi:hypothetical protein
VNVLDDITSGVTTTEEFDGEPYGFRVEWIKWYSGFRDSGLRPGDLVIALDGVPYEKANRQQFLSKAFGSYSEYNHWAEVGAKDGQTATVTVLRGRERLDISGKVLAERYWYDANNRRTIGPGGPDAMANDGFSGAWSGWLERSIEGTGARVLNQGWRLGGVSNNRQMLEEHLAEKDRVDFLVKQYPGPFATRTAEDFETIRQSLLGRRYEISEADLAWRGGSAEAAVDVVKEATTAKDALLARLAADAIPAFPAVDAMRGDRPQVVGKAVALPVLDSDDWTMDVMTPWLVAGNATDGWYLVQADSPAMRKAFEAMWRYKKKVAPDLPETHEIIGRIGPNPRMVVKAGVAIAGLEVEPIADLIGGTVFVDVTEDAPQFAGEAGLNTAEQLSLADDAAPEQVMAAFVLAIKQGNEEFWRGLFAEWDASRVDDGPPFQADAGPASSKYLSSEWIRARNLFQEKVADVRVVDVDEIRPIVKAGELPGAPAIEGTTVEVDHIGLFDGEYRAFKDVDVRRLFRLQRRDGGPWRFMDAQGI